MKQLKGKGNNGKDKAREAYWRIPSSRGVAIRTGPGFSARTPPSIVSRSPTITTVRLFILNVLIGGAFRLAGRDCSDAPTVGGEVVSRQIVHEGRGERRGYAAGGLEASWKLKRQVILRLVELVLRNRLVNPVELAEKLAECVDGFVGLDGGAFTSRLNTNLREEHGYAYGAGSSFAMRLGPGPFIASAVRSSPSTRGSPVMERTRTGPWSRTACGSTSFNM